MASNNNYENRVDEDGIPYAEPESLYLLNEVFRIEAANDVNHNNNLEIAEVVLNSAPINTSVELNSIQMSDKLKEIIRNVETDLDILVGHFGEMANNGFDKFIAVANSLFEDGVDWKKIIILIAFGYKWLAKFHKTITDGLAMVMKFLYKLLMSDQVRKFVIQSGGWKALLFQ